MLDLPLSLPGRPNPLASLRLPRCPTSCAPTTHVPSPTSALPTAWLPLARYVRSSTIVRERIGSRLLIFRINSVRPPAPLRGRVTQPVAANMTHHDEFIA